MRLAFCLSGVLGRMGLQPRFLSPRARPELAFVRDAVVVAFGNLNVT
jgi:hypothetical protein